jgi:Fe-Mn family superoxide dismutase
LLCRGAKAILFLKRKKCNQVMNAYTFSEGFLMQEDMQAGRRTFLRGALALAATAAAGKSFAGTAKKQPLTEIKQVPLPEGSLVDIVALPYEKNALEPVISARTVDLHYSHHHQLYADKTKGYIATIPSYQGLTLEQVIAKSSGGILEEESLNLMAVLLFNHNWYWKSLSPKGGIPPSSSTPLGSAVLGAFGSIENFKKRFIDESLKFGVGWVWLCLAEGRPIIQRFDYHDSPISKGYAPLLTLDVWEHAYYLDYQDDRKSYVTNVLDKLLDWNFAEQQFSMAQIKKK